MSGEDGYMRSEGGRGGVVVTSEGGYMRSTGGGVVVGGVGKTECHWWEIRVGGGGWIRYAKTPGWDARYSLNSIY